MILVDSNIYINWIRNRIEPHKIIEPWLRTDQIFSCGVIRIEVVRGIINLNQKDKVNDLFNSIPEFKIDNQFWEKSSNLAWHLDRKGRVIPLTDIVIATCALEIDATVISNDAHFDRIPRLKLRKTMPKFSIS